MSSSTPNIDASRVLTIPEGANLALGEAEAILELAYLCIAADRKLTEEELANFDRIAVRLRALTTGRPEKALTDREFESLLATYGSSLGRSAVDQRLRELGVTLSPSTRRLAYKTAVALAMCDLDASDAEFEFDLQLVDALELSMDEADKLTAEVHALFHVED